MATYTEVRQFIEKESRNLRKLRNTTCCLLLLVDLLVLFWFTHAFYSVYQTQGLRGDFMAYSFKTILSIQCILLLVFAPLLWIIYRRFQFILSGINDLNEEYALLYTAYCNSISRFFSTPPQYLVSQKGLLVFKNIKRVIFQPHSVEKISIRRINLGRFGKKCKVYIYQNNRMITSFSYPTLYPEEVEFLKQHIRLINSSLVLEDELS